MPGIVRDGIDNPKIWVSFDFGRVRGNSEFLILKSQFQHSPFCRPSGASMTFLHDFPGLAPWATVFRPDGALNTPLLGPMAGIPFG